MNMISRIKLSNYFLELVRLSSRYSGTGKSQNINAPRIETNNILDVTIM